MTKLALGVEFAENTKLTESVSIRVNLWLKILRAFSWLKNRFFTSVFAEASAFASSFAKATADKCATPDRSPRQAGQANSSLVARDSYLVKRI